MNCFSPISDLHIRSLISRQRAKVIDEDQGCLVHEQHHELKEISDSLERRKTKKPQLLNNSVSSMTW